MKEVTFIVKTFERLSCVKRLVRSIYKYYPGAIVRIADDSEVSCKNYIEKEYPDKDIKVYEISKDSGLSYGRNFLLDHVSTDYFVLLDDDFVFDKKTNIEQGIGLLVENDIDIIGGFFRNYSEVNKWYDWLKVIYREIFNKAIPCNYIGELNMDENNKILYANYRRKDFPEFCKTDIVHNFFVAKTDVIRDKNKWDDELKLQEHTAFFLNAKKNGIKVAFTNSMSVKHKPIRLKKYNSFRDRNFVQVFMERNNIDTIIMTYDGGEKKVVRKDDK